MCWHLEPSWHSCHMSPAPYEAETWRPLHGFAHMVIWELCALQAPMLTLLLPQDPAGRLGMASRPVSAAGGHGGITRRQLLHCIAEVYAAPLTPGAHAAAMQVPPAATCCAYGRLIGVFTPHAP